MSLFVELTRLNNSELGSRVVINLDYVQSIFETSGFGGNRRTELHMSDGETFWGVRESVEDLKALGLVVSRRLDTDEHGPARTEENVVDGVDRVAR